MTSPPPLGADLQPSDNEGMKSLDEKASIATTLRGTDLRAISADGIKEYLLKLLSGHKSLAVARTSQQVWHRARKAKDMSGFSTLTEVIYPRNGNANYGRANLPGGTVMYGAWNQSTALDEIEIETGDYVQVIAFRPRPGVSVQCHTVGDFERYQNTGRALNVDPQLPSLLEEFRRADPEHFRSSVFVDSFLSEFYGRINAVSYDYKLSAVYSQLLMEGAGVTFPSVRNKGGMNLAISAGLFDLSFEVLLTEVYYVARAWGYGLYGLQCCGRSTTFEADGTIRSGGSRVARHSMEGGVQFDDSPGWRTPLRTATGQGS